MTTSCPRANEGRFIESPQRRGSMKRRLQEWRNVLNVVAATVQNPSRSRMRIAIPRNGCSLTRLTSTAGAWSHKASVGPFHRSYNIPLPEGTDVGDLEVVAEGVGNDGKVIGPPVVLKARSKKVKPKPPVEAAPQAVVESTPESATKPKTDWRTKTKRKFGDQEIAQDERPTEQLPTAAAD